MAACEACNIRGMPAVEVAKFQRRDGGNIDENHAVTAKRNARLVFACNANRPRALS
jgi:hypothetical protein